jgi:hypothetical protein
MKKPQDYKHNEIITEKLRATNTKMLRYRMQQTAHIKQWWRVPKESCSMNILEGEMFGDL